MHTHDGKIFYESICVRGMKDIINDVEAPLHELIPNYRSQHDRLEPIQGACRVHPWMSPRLRFDWHGHFACRLVSQRL